MEIEHRILKRLVETPSIYPNEQQIGNVYQEILDDQGFKVEILDIGQGRRNILASRGNGGKALLFCGHQDTVPLVNETQWQTDPFELVSRGDRYYGLGVSDMKGGIAAFLEAFKVTPDRYLKVVLTVDEEDISEGAWAVVETRQDFFSDVELMVCAESNFKQPENSVAIGRVGRCIFDVQFEGSPAHIINYREGVDAISMLGGFLSKLYSKRDHMFNSPDSVIQVRRVDGAAVGMSVCANASAEVEVLLGAGDSNDIVMEKVFDLTGVKLSLKKRKTPYLPAYYFAHFPYQEKLSDIFMEHMGKAMEKYLRRSVGDENVLATLGIPIITYGADGGNEHQPNEFINTPSLNRLQTIYEEFVLSTQN